MRFVQTECLLPGMIVARNIISGNKAFMLSKGTVLTEQYIRRLIHGGYFGVYISDDFSSDVVINEAISEDLFQAGVEAVSEGDIGEMLDIATNVVSDIITKEDISLDLYDLRSYDDYTYHHSMNVAVYCAVVGKKLELDNENLVNLTQAAICHDLGKSRIDSDILNKPAKLSDEEYEKIKKHPKFSYDILSERQEISAKIKQAVICHHENENGSGYPYGKVSEDIPYLAKIIHAVDVYDALTSKRAYKEPYTPSDAFEYLIGGKGVLFDPKIVDVMLEVIPAYPPGTDVILSNDEEALVLAHTSDMRRPIIKLKSSGKLINLELDKDYNDISIVKSGVILHDYAETVEALNENRKKAANRKEKVMVVDDSTITLMNVTKTLQDEYDVVSFHGGMEALAYLTDNDCPDLILMDVDMPVVNGIQTINNMKKTGKLTCPFIFLTGDCSRETVIRCRKIGAIDYILKPLKPVYLLERVAYALKRYRE